jgi:F-type H+-transporting ATPase subunit beta
MRARKLRLFLTQPFFTTEAYTGLPGEYVSLAQTLEGCSAILSGECDDLPESAFRFTGGIEQVGAKAKDES